MAGKERVDVDVKITADGIEIEMKVPGVLTPMAKLTMKLAAGRVAEQDNLETKADVLRAFRAAIIEAGDALREAFAMARQVPTYDPATDGATDDEMAAMFMARQAVHH